MLVVVVGLGEIGTAVTEAMLARAPGQTIVGVDCDANARARWAERFPSLSYSSLIPAHPAWTSICVMNQDAILATAKDACQQSVVTGGVVAIESTMSRRVAEELSAIPAVAFPHRFNPGDEDHHVFNLTRVLGGREPYLGRAIAFLRDVFAYEQAVCPGLIADSFVGAAMTKLLENAYRAMEIILAQETSLAMGEQFDAIRRAANTKWNIDIKEARDGVKGKCLPKDLDLFLEAFPSHGLARVLRALNRDYIARGGKQ